MKESKTKLRKKGIFNYGRWNQDGTKKHSDCTLVRDFLNGKGCFSHFSVGIEEGEKKCKTVFTDEELGIQVIVSDNQRSLYNHHRIIPLALFEYLHRRGIIRDFDPNDQGVRNLGGLLELLGDAEKAEKDTAKPLAGEMREQILRQYFPDMGPLGSVSHSYSRIENEHLKG